MDGYPPRPLLSSPTYNYIQGNQEISSNLMMLSSDMDNLINSCTWISTGREGTLDFCWLDSRRSLLASIDLIIVLGAFDTISSSSVADIVCVRILVIVIKNKSVSYINNVSNREFKWLGVVVCRQMNILP